MKGSRRMKKIAVIGAGIMGRGVAQLFAEHEYRVVLVDMQEDALTKAKKNILQECQIKRMLLKYEEEEPVKVVDRIEMTTSLEKISGVEYIIENINEKLPLKIELYKQLSKIYSENCIVLANTSCISITRLASYMSHPENVVGVHFMNPVSAIPAVELIRGYHSENIVVEKTKRMLESIGKNVIIVNDFPGFVSNRISHLMMNEAAFIVQDGIATVKDIDEIFKQCYGHKMGPLETADLIGIDTVVDSLNVLFESYQDTKFRCCPLLRKMADAGLHGIKTGKGFYQY